MIMTTVLAVALGLAPVKDGEAVRGDYAKAIGRYSQTVDKQGTVHLRGRFHGSPYEIDIDRNGQVEGTAGDFSVSFLVTDAS